MFKNLSGQFITVYAYDSTTFLAKTGDAANLTAYVQKDGGSVTILGDTSASEKSSSNAAGQYYFDLTQAETNADTLVFSCKSSTSNVVVICMPTVVYTRPPNFQKLVIDSAGLADANAVKIGPTGSGTAQTARDIGASVLLSSGTGTGQIKIAAGYVAMTWADIAAPTSTQNLSGTSIATAGGSLDAAGVRSAVGMSTANLDTQLSGINSKTTNLPSDPADQSLVVAATTAIYDRLGAPAGASIAADIAGISGGLDAAGVRAAVGLGSADLDTQLGAISTKTTNLPAAPASTTNITAGTITTVTNLTNAPTNGDLTATMKTSVTTAATAATPTIAGYTGNTPQTGDSYVRLGAPAGASVSADVAGVASTIGAAGAGLTGIPRSGYKLASDGLDSIDASEPSGVPTTFPKKMMAIYMRWFRKVTKTSTQIKTHAADNTTVVMTQAISDDGTTQTQGPGT